MATDDVNVLHRITKQLFSHFHIDVKDIRGIGLHVTKLESVDNFKQGNERSSIRCWLASAREAREASSSSRDEGNQGNSLVGANLSNRSSDVPPLNELDLEVLESLPPEILSERNDLYGGKLKGFLLKPFGMHENWNDGDLSVFATYHFRED